MLTQELLYPTASLSSISATARSRKHTFAALFAITVLALCASQHAGAQTCYSTGDSTYSSATTEQVTLCHSTADEGLYYDTPDPTHYTTYGQFVINVQPMRIAPETYRTLMHTNAYKIENSPNCPLTANGSAGTPGIGYPGLLSAATPPTYPTYTGLLYPYPFYTYAWCTVGDSIREGSYNATSPSDTTPYTFAVTPIWALKGNESVTASASFTGRTTGTLTTTLSSAMTSGTTYANLPINALPFPVGENAILTIGTGATTQSVQLAPWPLVNLTSALTSGTKYTTLSTTGLPFALTPNTALAFPITVSGITTIQAVNTTGTASTLTTGMVSGTSYSTLHVAALPYALASGTLLTLGNASLQGRPIPQTVTVSSTASAGSTTISVTSFVANNTYGVSTPVLAPAIPAGATTIPVNPFVASASVAVPVNLYALGLPQGATTLPVQAVTEPTSFPPVPGTGVVANANYPSGTTITLQGDHNGLGGMANQMTVAGRYYAGDPYYYTFLIGENRTDPSTTTCAWEPMSAGPCGWREILEEARTTDFVNWQVLSNVPVASGGPWLNFTAIDATHYPVPVKDRNGNPIEGNYVETAGNVRGLLGSVNQVYSPADGVHTFRYFYSDRPAPSAGNSWQSDTQLFNLYERHASTDDAGSFSADGNIIWSAPTLVGPAPDNRELARIAKARGSNRWALAFTASQSTSSTQSTDVQVEYTADMTNMIHTNWLDPLTHLLNNFPVDNTHSLAVQSGRQFGTGYISPPDSYGFQKAYYDGLVQIDFMTDRDGNLAAPDIETPGWKRGGMITWTETPIALDNTVGGSGFWYGGFGGGVYRAGFDISSNLTGDLAINGDFGTQTFTGNATYDGWSMIDESQPSNGGGTNYPATVLTSGASFLSGSANGLAALIGPPLSATSESVGGTGIDQIISLPSGLHHASMSFSYWPKCPAGASSGDYQTAYVYNVDTGTTTWVVLPSCDNSQTWKSATVDLSSFIGHQALFIFVTRKVNTTNTSPVYMGLGCSTSCFSVKVD